MNHPATKRTRTDGAVRRLLAMTIVLGCAGTVVGAAAQTVTSLPTPAIGHTSTRGAVIRPQSNIEHPGDIGVRAHTNVELLIPTRGGARTSSAPDFEGVTPANTTPAPGFVA